MIPYILAAVGGYLIGKSQKQTPPKMEDGGLMKDFEKNFTTAYILQQKLAEKEKQSSSESSKEFSPYDHPNIVYTGGDPNKSSYYPMREHEGERFASLRLRDSMRDSSGNLKGSDERDIEDGITAYFDEDTIVFNRPHQLYQMWKDGKGINVEKRKKKWYEF